MKKIIAGIVAIVFLAAFVAVGVSAAEFVKSPEKNTMTVTSATVDGQDVAASLTLTPSTDADDLSAEKKAELDAAYKAIVEDKVDAIPENYKVGGLYDLSYDGELKGSVTVSFAVNLGKVNVKVIYQNVETGAWDVAESKYEDGVITATFAHLCPVAVLVEDVIVTDPSQGSPTTGDAPSTAMMVVGSLIVFGGAVAAVFMRKRENA